MEDICKDNTCQDFYVNTDFNSCSDEDLRRLWRERWKGLQRDFCDQQNCNRGNFNNWLQGRRQGGASRLAVVRWLSKRGPIPTPPSQPQDISLIADVYILVDGDNCGHMLGRLSEDVEERTKRGEFVQFLYFSTVDSRCSKALELSEKPWFVSIPSKSTCKDATDHTLTFWASRLHFQAKKDSLFVLVSRDGFIQELYLLLTSLSRRCSMFSAIEI